MKNPFKRTPDAKKYVRTLQSLFMVADLSETYGSSVWEFGEAVCRLSLTQETVDFCIDYVVLSFLVTYEPLWKVTNNNVQSDGSLHYLVVDAQHLKK